MTCVVVTCDEPRTPSSLFCRPHLTQAWHNELDRQADGTFVRRADLQPRSEPAWLARARQQPHGLARDMTRSIA